MHVKQLDHAPGFSNDNQKSDGVSRRRSYTRFTPGTERQAAAKVPSTRVIWGHMTVICIFHRKKNLLQHVTVYEQFTQLPP